MKAIILTAGYGERMRPLTDAGHKTLLEVGGQTIISRIVAGLRDAGIGEIVVVTGHRAADVEEHLRRSHPSVDFVFVRNERYRETNNISSMALAFERMTLDDDVLLVEGDLVCDAAVFERIARSPHADVALVDRYRTGMDGTVVTVEGGVITSVIPPHLQSGDFSFADKYKTLNIYKFSREFCQKTFRRLLAAYAAIDESCYYEIVLGILIYVKKAVIHAEIIEQGVPPYSSTRQVRVLAAGGNIRAIASVDAQLRITGPLAAAMFSDAGIVTNDWRAADTGDIRPGAGMAVRVILPFGAVSLEYAVPLRPRLGDDPRGRIHFGFAMRFD